MAWENIEERLKKPFTVEIPHADGHIWLPGSRLDIDEWLTSIAQTDEELKELNIRRIRFLQNRWPVEKLLQLEWDSVASRRMVLAMYVHNRTYVLYFDGFTFDVAGALEPKDKPALYQALVGKILHDSRLVPSTPRRIKNLRPDLIPQAELDELQHHHETLPRHPAAAPKKRGYLARLLIGWVGNWIELPVLGYWHDDDFENKDDRMRKAS